MAHDGYWYQRDAMPPTDGGRRIETIDGSPEAINLRGQAIVELGSMMKSAALTLAMFADGTVGKGQSFEAVREQAKEVHADLKVAADRYAPSGEALVAYAAALSTAQAETDNLVVSAAAAWERVNSASRSLSAAESEQQAFDFDASHDVEQTGQRPTSGAEEASFSSALEDFESYAARYDAPAEHWEQAYDSAVRSLETVNEDGVSDGFWDNAMPFIEGLLKVLTVVGIVLLIAAFVLTGPLAAIAGAIAAIVGVISLLGEIARLANGRGSWQEVALAGVAIIPFGKLGKLANLGDFAAAGSRFPRLTGAFRLAGSEFTDAAAAMRTLDGYLATRVPGLFSGAHGLNSINLMRVLHSPGVISDAFATTGSWGNAWRALAGFQPGQMPANLVEALGGVAQGYTQGISALVGAKSLFE